MNCIAFFPKIKMYSHLCSCNTFKKKGKVVKYLMLSFLFTKQDVQGMKAPSDEVFEV